MNDQPQAMGGIVVLIIIIAIVCAHFLFLMNISNHLKNIEDKMTIDALYDPESVAGK